NQYFVMQIKGEKSKGEGKKSEDWQNGHTALVSSHYFIPGGLDKCYSCFTEWQILTYICLCRGSQSLKSNGICSLSYPGNVPFHLIGDDVFDYALASLPEDHSVAHTLGFDGKQL
ncbi:hypothetical protein STEG23_017790, partial [Scotinomys teguina]